MKTHFLVTRPPYAWQLCGCLLLTLHDTSVSNLQLCRVLMKETEPSFKMYNCTTSHNVNGGEEARYAIRKSVESAISHGVSSGVSIFLYRTPHITALRNWFQTGTSNSINLSNKTATVSLFTVLPRGNKHAQHNRIWRRKELRKVKIHV